MTLKIAVPETSLSQMSSTKTEGNQSRFFLFLFCALALPLTGCGGDQIEVYRVAKEGKIKEVTASLPPSWETAPLGEMRAVSFRVRGAGNKTADISVIPLPGQAGRDVDNVNRWRGQVGQSAVSESEVGKLAKPVEITGQTAALYEMTGENPASGDQTSILAAILRKDGTAWFFKMAGDSSLVEQQKANFISYLKTFQFPAESESARPASNDAELPPGHPPPALATQSAVAPVPTSGRPNWVVPAGWREIDGGQFLVAKFLVPGTDNSQAIVNVSMSAGNGGGVSANVNRWRKQLGLREISESAANEAVKSVGDGDAKMNLVELAGTDSQSGNPVRMLAMIVPEKSQTWFYKFTGTTSLVEREEEAFVNFVRTTKYSE